MHVHCLALIRAELPGMQSLTQQTGEEPLQALQQFLLTSSLVNTAKCQNQQDIYYQLIFLSVVAQG